MALTLGDNFSYQGAKPLDARLKYDTLAAMKAVADSTMYDGCMAYCVATDKTYQWKSTNTIDEDTGKWREYASGGGQTIQVTSLPTATSSEVGKVYQYIGADTQDYTHGYFYECVADTSASSTIYSWEAISVQEGGGSASVMRGATNYADGKEGLAPKPYTTDVGKALFGDGKYHTVYTAASGSTILAITDDSSFYGRTVTLTDGISTITETMGSNGECYFTDVLMFGNVTVSCSDELGNEAKATLNLTYFGTYVCNLTLNFATLRFTSTDIDIVGQEVEVWFRNTKVATTSLRLVSGSLVADVIVEELGDYTAKISNSPKGFGKASVTVTALKETYIVPLMLYHIYAYKIDEADSNPATCVTAYDSEWGCENLEFTPAHMDYSNDTFDMGSWTGTEFFFPRPCMLKYDGTVDYYLDPDDYTKKADGTPSDVTDFSYEGNCMVEFPTVYFKRWQAANVTYVCISDKKLSSDFHAYAHHDKNGNVLPYIYLSAYDGSYDGTRLRSISGAPFNTGSSVAQGKILNFRTLSQQIALAEANNGDIDGAHEGHNLWHKADYDLVLDLLTLLSNTTNSQTAFGKGKVNGGSQGTAGSQVTTGSMNDKGMFWGENTGAYGVKVLGIENFFSNINKNAVGLINAKGTIKAKMTYGQEDGSTVNGFNATGSGYVTLPLTYAGSSGTGINGWSKSWYGYLYTTLGGDTSHYLCDVGYRATNTTMAFGYGGGCYEGENAGMFYQSIALDATVPTWDRGAALSCK